MMMMMMIVATMVVEEPANTQAIPRWQQFLIFDEQRKRIGLKVEEIVQVIAFVAA